MGREQQLEQQLAELRKARESLIAKISDCLTQPDAVKARHWNDVVPHIKNGIEQKIRTGELDIIELKQIVFDKIMKAVCGDNVYDLLNKV